MPRLFLLGLILTATITVSQAANWVRTGGIGGGQAYQLIAHGGELFAGTDSGLYRTPLDNDAWRPFGPPGLAHAAFARTAGGWIAHRKVYTPGGFPMEVRVFVTKDEGANWSESAMPGWVEGMASNGDTLFAYALEDTSAFPGNWYSTNGGLVWKESAFHPAGDIKACAFIPGGILCATSRGVFRGAVTAGGIASDARISSVPVWSAMGEGRYLYAIDSACILRKLGAGGEVWSAPVPSSNPRLIAVSDSAVVVADSYAIYFAPGKPDPWTVLKGSYGANRYLDKGAWSGGWGYFPARQQGVQRIRIVSGVLEARAFGRGMDGSWVTMMAPMASRLYARAGAGFWRLDESTGIFQPYFQDPWAARLLWSDGRTALAAPWFEGIPPFFSRDDGKTWLQIPPFTEGLIFAMGKIDDLYLAFAPKRTGVGYGLFGTLDPAAGWSLLRDVDSDKNNFAIVGGALYHNTGGGLFRSLDTGRTWLHTRVPLAKAERFIVDGAFVLATGDSGACFLSADRGASWRDLGNPAGAPVSIWELAIVDGRAVVSVFPPASESQGILFAQASVNGPWTNLGAQPSSGNNGVAVFGGKLWTGSYNQGAFAAADPNPVLPAIPFRPSDRPAVRRLAIQGNQSVTVAKKAPWRDAGGRTRSSREPDAAGWEYRKP